MVTSLRLEMLVPIPGFRNDWASDNLGTPEWDHGLRIETEIEPIIHPVVLPFQSATSLVSTVETRCFEVSLSAKWIFQCQTYVLRCTWRYNPLPQNTEAEDIVALLCRKLLLQDETEIRLSSRYGFTLNYPESESPEEVD